MIEAHYKKIYTCISSSNPLEHFLNKTLYLFHASHNGSSIPCTNVVMAAFAPLFLGGGEN